MQLEYSLKPTEIELAIKAHETIKAKVNYDRADKRVDSDLVSQIGLGAEIAAPRILLPGIAKKLIKTWASTWNDPEAGSNTGKDFDGKLFGLSKNIEIKTTLEELSPQRCTECEALKRQQGPVLYVRSGSTDYNRGDPDPPIEYWEGFLPDSYYLLLICNIEKSKKSKKIVSWTYKFTGWGTRKTFFRHFDENNAVRQKLGTEGYPIIGLFNNRIHKPRAFMDISS